jgi:MFS family permease
LGLVFSENFFSVNTDLSNYLGVFSNAFATTIMKDKVTTTELMGVGTTFFVCVNIFTPMSPLLARLGTRLTMVLGSILLSLGLILTSFATEIWHVYLTQGVLSGLGSSILYMSIVEVIPQWFTTRRATAMGISSSGSGFGGLALSPMVSSLIQKYGLPWTYRIIGLMALGICLLASCMMRTRLPPGHDKKQPIRSPIKLSMLKDIDFVIWLIGVVISLTSYLIPLFYIPSKLFFTYTQTIYISY